MHPLELISKRQSEAHARRALNVWTVYDNPKDFPGSHVARRFEFADGQPVATSDIIQGELSDIREAFDRCGLVCLMRNEGDEPQIVETWI